MGWFRKSAYVLSIPWEDSNSRICSFDKSGRSSRPSLHSSRLLCFLSGYVTIGQLTNMFVGCRLAWLFVTAVIMSLADLRLFTT